jgi:hypothetical protein
MWTTQKISADAASKLQINAGLLLKNFNVNNPVEPADEDIICETTGNFSISSVPTMEDFFADINNAPKNTKEGLRVTGWEHTLGVTAVSITQEMLLLALNMSERDALPGSVGISPRNTVVFRDTIYWIGDIACEDQLLVVEYRNVASTGGLNLTTSDNGKGSLSLTLKAYESRSFGDIAPVSYNIIKKAEGTSAVSEEE